LRVPSPRSLGCIAAAVLLVHAAAPTEARAAPLNPWGAHVGEGVFALTPFLYVDQTPRFYPLVYGQYGVSSKLELLAGAGASFGGGPFSFDGIEVMPRYFFTDEAGAALHISWAPGADPTIAPEYHGAYENGSFALTVNLGWGPSIGSNGFQPGSVYALIAPELYLTDATSVFLEIDPSFGLGSGYPAGSRFYMELVPGISTSIAETHYLAFGVAIPTAPFSAGGIYFGAWYSIGFGGA
jgi:hypothetical protein